MCDAGGINFAWLYILFIFADGGSMKSFGSLEDLLVNELYEVGSAPEPQESELTEVSTADHCSEISEITVDSAPIDNGGELTTASHCIEPGDQVEASPQDKTLIADSKSDDELNATVVAAQGAQPSVADTSAIGTMWIVHPHRELNQAVAETSDELLEVVEERVPHTNLSPEAIVNEVEAVQVAVPVEPHGVFSIVSCLNNTSSYQYAFMGSHTLIFWCYTFEFNLTQREAIVSLLICFVMCLWGEGVNLL